MPIQSFKRSFEFFEKLPTTPKKARFRNFRLETRRGWSPLRKKKEIQFSRIFVEYSNDLTLIRGTGSTQSEIAQQRHVDRFRIRNTREECRIESRTFIIVRSNISLSWCPHVLFNPVVRKREDEDLMKIPQEQRDQRHRESFEVVVLISRLDRWKQNEVGWKRKRKRRGGRGGKRERGRKGKRKYREYSLKKTENEKWTKEERTVVGRLILLNRRVVSRGHSNNIVKARVIRITLQKFYSRE